MQGQRDTSELGVGGGNTALKGEGAQGHSCVYTDGHHIEISKWTAPFFFLGDIHMPPGGVHREGGRPKTKRVDSYLFTTCFALVP